MFDTRKGNSTIRPMNIGHLLLNTCKHRAESSDPSLKKEAEVWMRRINRHLESDRKKTVKQEPENARKKTFQR